MKRLEEKFDKFYKTQTENSRIKANIVAEYFPSYARILLKKPQSKIRYLDLFAGPGKYGDNNQSTPLLIIDACINDSILSQKVQLIFNDMKYIKELEENIKNNYDVSKLSYRLRFGERIVGEDELLDTFLKKVHEKKNPSPTLLFFDPFGYKAINTEVLGEFMKNWGNEIFLFFNSKRINAAIDNQYFDELMKNLFPCNYATIRKDKRYTRNVNERLGLIRSYIQNEFQQIIKGQVFMSSFRFMEEDNIATSHFVLHITKHHKGYELAKQVFHEYDNIGAPLDKYGTYTFDSKRQSMQMGFDLGDPNVLQLSKMLKEEFKSKEISAEKLFKNHQKNNPFSAKHYVLALRELKENGDLTSYYTDNKSHKVSVLLIKECILKFK